MRKSKSHFELRVKVFGEKIWKKMGELAMK